MVTNYRIKCVYLDNSTTYFRHRLDANGEPLYTTLARKAWLYPTKQAAKAVIQEFNLQASTELKQAVVEEC